MPRTLREKGAALHIPDSKRCPGCVEKGVIGHRAYVPSHIYDKHLRTEHPDIVKRQQEYLKQNFQPTREELIANGDIENGFLPLDLPKRTRQAPPSTKPRRVAFDAMPIEDRNLAVGTVLVARHKKQDYKVTVVANPEGEGVLYELEDGRTFKSLSSAGGAVTQGSVNGWRFWSLPGANGTKEKKVKEGMPAETKPKRAAKAKAKVAEPEPEPEEDEEEEAEIEDSDGPVDLLGDD